MSVTEGQLLWSPSQETVDQACPSSNKWDRCVVRLGECFAHYFHITRRAVSSANAMQDRTLVSNLEEPHIAGTLLLAG